MWSSILGHAEQIARLQSAVTNDRLASAYLFAGPEGIGKFRVAVTLAQALLCEVRGARCEVDPGPQTPDLAPRTSDQDPCGRCPICSRIAAGTHPDVLLIAPEKTEIKVDQVRAMRERMQFHPLEGAMKVVIVDQAEAMHATAANACLKILEEPPTATLFLLVSAQPHRLLPTIRSRCQTIIFQPLPTATVVRMLIRDRQLTHDEAAGIASIAEGSPGFAQRCAPELIQETATDLSTLDGTHDGARVLQIAERWAADPVTLPVRLHLCALCCRTALVPQRHDAAPLPPFRAFVQRLATVAPERLTTHLTTLLHLVQDAASTTFNKQLLCESLLFSFSRQ